MAKHKNRIQELDQGVEGVAEQYASIKEDMAGLRDDFAALFHSLMDAGNSGLKDAQSRIGDELQERIDDVRQRLNAVRDRGRDSVASIQSKIEERPFTSMLVAVSAGWLIAKMFRRS